MTHRENMAPRSVAVVLGTRPEVIKLAPVLSLLGEAGQIVHTGQHFDHELFALIAADTGIEPPADSLAIGGRTRSEQIGAGVLGLEPHLRDMRGVIVQGDTNSSLAGGLVANAMEIPLFHVEAGLRSYDRRMPEEHNRVLIDHLADICWAPTAGNVQNLAAEGIGSHRVEETGNTIIEAMQAVVPNKSERAERRRARGINDEEYIVVTMHRPENVDDSNRLGDILKVLGHLPVRVVFPIHPRTRLTIESAGLGEHLERLSIQPSLGYRDFLSFLADCQFAVSDSGGIQEEVSILKVPLIVIRRSTERPEVLGTFAQLLSDVDEMDVLAREWLDSASEIHERLSGIESPFGDGSAASRIYESLLGHLQ